MAKLYLGDSQGAPAIVKVQEVDVVNCGLTIDAIIGKPNEDGVLEHYDAGWDFHAIGVKEVPDRYFYERFAELPTIRDVDLRGVAIIGDYAFSSCFRDCSRLHTVILDSIESVGQNAFYEFCYNCLELGAVIFPQQDWKIETESAFARSFCNCVNLGGVKHLNYLTEISRVNSAQYMFYNTPLNRTRLFKLTKINGTRCAQYMFSNCRNLVEVDLDALQMFAGTAAGRQMFDGCDNLTKVNFYSLEKFSSSAFYDSSLGIFQNCNRLLEIHFRSSVQSKVEKLAGYDKKFGATNATIYFDLVSTIMVNDIIYNRDELNTIRNDMGDRKWVAWVNEVGDRIYTNASSEPTVNDLVYECVVDDNWAIQSNAIGTIIAVS